MSKAKKRIAIVDALPSLVEHFLNYVRDKYDFELVRAYDADYVFHSVGGYEVLKYPGVRIFVTGENVTPNFAISDYALAFEKMTFGDRYIWHPLIKAYKGSYETFSKPRRPAAEIVGEKNAFCAYVMSNMTDSAEERCRIFDLLSAYKKVNSGGKWRNNVGGRVPDKNAFQASHKFAITFENYSYPGYLTEKFAQAAEVNAIPIYWGDPEIGKIFNPKAFVNCHDFDSLEEAVEHVKQIDQNDTLYRNMLSEPWFLNGSEPGCLRNETFATFLDNIFAQDLPLAYRRNRSRWGLKTERQLYNMYHRPYRQGFELFRKKWRKAWKSVLPRRKFY